MNELTHDSFAERLGAAVTETLIRTGYSAGDETPEELGRRLALAAAAEVLARSSEPDLQVRDLYVNAIKSLGLDSTEAAGLLGMEVETFHAWFRDYELIAVKSTDEILSLAAALNQVEFVMGPDVGRNWLNSPCLLLGSREPADLLQSGEAARVSRALDAIHQLS